ncbi:hypothetical protein [Parabacteroides gordonii]|jgi:hypothetical protein|uniref:hypothetical protein n=1 Tax=Parabacteroides gordonii TaxID=574930 RepID=UPI00241E2FD8|nr:hypothetical protein [Parabacteroides gordonii]
MAKIKKILEFILALLNFLFHFKPTPDEETIAPVENYPCPTSSLPPFPSPFRKKGRDLCIQ